MPKIRVLHFVVRLSYGGIEKWLSDVLSHYDHSQFQMDVCCIAKRPDLGELVDQVRQNGAQIHYLPINHPKFFLQLVKLLHGNYDVLFAHLEPAISVVLLFAGFLARVPVRVLSHHNTDFSYMNRWPVIRSLLLNISAGFSKYVTGCSQSTLDILHPGWRMNPKYIPLYYGIDLERFVVRRDKSYLAPIIGEDTRSPVVGHIGRFSPQKNHPAFVAMAGELIKCAPNTKFVLIGQGILRTQIEKLVAERDLSDSFGFLGSRSDIPELLNSIDVLYFPSHYEGFPVTFIEAQAAGVPVVTGTRPELREAICPENVDLLSVDTGSPVIAAQRIDQLLTDQVLWQLVSRRGQDWARQNFSIEKSTRRLEEIILSGMAGPSSPASEVSA